MLVVALLVTAMLAAPADSLTGTWHVTGDIMGNPLDEICTLKQTGTSVTGSCRASAPADAPSWAVTGEVKGDSVSFSHGGDYEGTPLTIAYSATRGAGARLEGNVMVAPFGAGGTFAATPAPAIPRP